ncbi:MAG: EF-hand domain-containing protein [Planctomycetota bacterium]|nr:EF-hand domain-containing protein [Planctomycetota bacterium]
MRLLLIAALSLLLLPVGVLADEADEEGAAPPAPPPAGGGRRGGPRGGMLERLKQMDANGDGTITREEFRGPARFFDRLDADGDGELTTEEVERAASRGGRSGRAGGRSGGLTPGALDTDRDNKVSKAELDAWFEKADQNGDGFVDAAEWTAALSGRALRDPAPAVGASAPKVKAKRLGKDEHVDLGQVKRITVLIFGSHT